MAFNSDCGTWTFTWPYPRMHVLGNKTIGITPVDDFFTCYAGSGGPAGVAMFDFVNDGTDWNAYPLLPLGAKTSINQISIASFGKTHIVATFDESNEITKVYSINDSYSYTGPVSVEEISFSSNGYPSGICVCNFKGRCIVGGVHSTQSPWKELGFSSIAWSAPGKLVFSPEANKGAGFMHLPIDDNGKGYIYSVKRLNNMVVAYGKFGVCGLKPYSTEHAVGFGLVETSQPGTKNGGMVGGDDHVHLYIDDRGDGWLVTGDMEYKRLGYREFFSPMISTLSVSNPILISYVPGRKRFYISNATLSYVLTEWGLYQCHQRTTGANLYHDKLVGFFSDSEDYGWRFKTGKLDFGLRALKTLETVEVGGVYRSLNGTTPRNIQTVIEHKYNHYDNGFTALGARNVNPTGFVFPQVTSNEFRVQVKGDEYRSSDLRMDYLSMGVKLVDKRGIRRIYGNVSKGNAG